MVRPFNDGAIAEAAYAFDTLKCDGIGVMDSVAVRFLGDSAFEEFMQELNRRGRKRNSRLMRSTQWQEATRLWHGFVANETEVSVFLEKTLVIGK